ncbi:MAG: hypothetical protein KJT01_13985 [Gemmatimonadetes bacterium]|nr:hypothetical protein [Gemmatimonadota bacterium]
MRALLLALALTPAVARAQNEAALRQAFEGKLVSVRMAMPGTAKGVDVFPQQQMAINYRQVADRIKEFGTALDVGAQVMVTKVVVKKDSHIEFQLGGGGFGTFGDDAGTQRIFAGFEGESARERALRDSIKTATDAKVRARMQRDLNSARAARQRENDKARAEAEQANAAREANLRGRRQEGGSRFNVRYQGGIPADALTPDGLMAALGPYVDFAATGAKGATAAAAAAAPGGASSAASATAPAPSGAGGLTALRKGLSVREVEALLGPAVTAAEEKQGPITVLKRNYASGGMKVAASFVNDILVDFTISPR